MTVVRSDAAPRLLPADCLAQARQRVLQTITAAVPREILAPTQPSVPPKQRLTSSA